MTTTVVSLTEPSVTKLHLSFSAINDAARCGKMYQLKRVLALPEAPGYAPLAGRAVHSATEAYDRMLYAETGR